MNSNVKKIIDYQERNKNSTVLISRKNGEISSLCAISPSNIAFFKHKIECEDVIPLIKEMGKLKDYSLHSIEYLTTVKGKTFAYAITSFNLR
jgi:hypothetical protein